VSGDSFCEVHEEKYWEKDGCFYCEINKKNAEPSNEELVKEMKEDLKQALRDEKADSIEEMLKKFNISRENKMGSYPLITVDSVLDYIKELKGE